MQKPTPLLKSKTVDTNSIHNYKKKNISTNVKKLKL